MRVCSSGIINNIRCELIKISPEHSTHPAGQVEDGSGTSLQRRVSSIAQVLAAPEEKRSGRGFDGKGGGFRMENLAKELGVVISVPLVASDRIGKEVIETEHGQSQITFYGNSFIAGITSNETNFRYLCDMRGPTGEIVSEADDKTEAVLVSQFSLEKIKSKRQSWGGVP
ncbi:hypothetical protein Bca101_036662 [Brassica carinata]